MSAPVGLCLLVAGCAQQQKQEEQNVGAEDGTVAVGSCSGVPLRVARTRKGQQGNNQAQDCEATETRGHHTLCTVPEPNLQRAETQDNAPILTAALSCCRADPIHQATRKPADPNPVTSFRPVNPPKKGGPGTVARNFAGRAKGACGEFEWRQQPDATDQASGSSGGADAAAAGVAFRPSAFPKKGPMATFNRFPGKAWAQL